MTIRLVLAEDSFIVREGVRLLIEEQDGLDLVDVAEDLPSLMAAVAAHEPDVVLTDIRMPPTGTDEGIQAAAEIRDLHPSMGVLVLSQYVEPEYALRLFEGGSEGRGYLLKERVGDVGELLAAIRDVHGGGSVMDPKVVEALVGARRAEDSPLERLTPREREVLSEIATGKNNAAVAEALVLSERAVEKHINSIFSKLDLSFDADGHKRVRAVLLYLGELS
jgi:DNA-binding NarL/FixJ family response regulator